jgi:5'-methylthioadenosine phosphorylase
MATMPGPGEAKPRLEPLRSALLDAARATGCAVRDGGCYGHVDGPRFNTQTEIRMLTQAGVTAVSQTAGPETVLAGEAKLPYALVGYATDYANGVKPEAPTPVEELIRLVEASTGTFARTLAAAVPRVTTAPEPVGTHFSWD